MMSDTRTHNNAARRWWGVLALGMVALLAACQPASTPPPPDEGTITRPDLVGLIEWNGAPDAVVFRAERINNQPDNFFSLGEVPDCTVYGDNRLVYPVPGEGEGTLVAVDQVSSEAVRTFIEDLTLNAQIFGQSAGFEALPAEERPTDYQRVEININAQSHQFDSIGGWDEAYYAALVQRCIELSTAPAEFAPDTGAWLTVREVEYDPNQPAIIWDVAVTGLDLSGLGTERQWVPAAGSVMLWERLRAAIRPDIQFQQDDRTYQVVIQVPGITRNAPPTP